MRVAAANLPLSVEEYLEGELLSEIRHEYVDGEVFAMSGTSKNHNRIALNTAFHLRSVTRGTGCGVYMSDMKVRIEAGNRFYYPDVVVSCAPSDGEAYFERNPCLLAEVLSPSTEATDRREKWLAYRDLPSLRYYLLISAQEPRAEAYCRQPSGGWVHLTLAEDEPLAIDFEGLRLTLSLQDIYEDVRW